MRTEQCDAIPNVLADGRAGVGLQLAGYAIDTTDHRYRSMLRRQTQYLVKLLKEAIQLPVGQISRGQVGNGSSAKFASLLAGISAQKPKGLARLLTSLGEMLRSTEPVLGSTHFTIGFACVVCGFPRTEAKNADLSFILNHTITRVQSRGHRSGESRVAGRGPRTRFLTGQPKHRGAAMSDRLSGLRDLGRTPIIFSPECDIGLDPSDIGTERIVIR
ncbi:hypothetical protein [Actinomadura roseirufa]|uniref:hypothetical protein n=1 Tax=Actinomadura roseirufa TaxID=2094049 RepID=UPI00104172D9|nr:hypothetical protein [Actinomadura roseirufa]